MLFHMNSTMSPKCAIHLALGGKGGGGGGEGMSLGGSTSSPVGVSGGVSGEGMSLGSSGSSAMDASRESAAGCSSCSKL